MNSIKYYSNKINKLYFLNNYLMYKPFLISSSIGSGLISSYIIKRQMDSHNKLLLFNAQNIFKNVKWNA